MYECKTSYEIQSEILHRLGIDYGIYGPRGNASDLDLIKEQWALDESDAIFRELAKSEEATELTCAQ